MSERKKFLEKIENRLKSWRARIEDLDGELDSESSKKPETRRKLDEFKKNLESFESRIEETKISEGKETPDEHDDIEKTFNELAKAYMALVSKFE